ncbi:hypothetical protein B0H14DRAFT_2571208 [Mycena olivaceomarginata]|nr:hypothetical protein B0H14DRAFT_2571208 [Mycena olivaceomarginata]
MNDPPADLKLEFTHSRQRKAKAAAVMSANSVSTEPPLWVQHLMPVVGALFGGNRIANQAYLPAPAPATPVPAPVTPAPAYAPITVEHVIASDDLSAGPGPKRGIDSLCPDIDTWLAELDSDPIRGRMKLNYTGAPTRPSNGTQNEGDAAVDSIAVADDIAEWVDTILEDAAPLETDQLQSLASDCLKAARKNKDYRSTVLFAALVDFYCWMPRMGRL